MNITLSVDSEIVEKARKWSREHGTSLNAVIREQLSSLAGKGDNETAARQFRENAVNSSGRSELPRPFNREELYSGKRFGTE